MHAAAVRPVFWHRPVLFLAGAAAFARGVIGRFYPDYWSPVSVLDYSAVAGTSLFLLLMAAGLWGFYQRFPGRPGLAQVTWRAAMILSCVSAAAMGLSNLFEDAFGLRFLGAVWVVGILALALGMIAAGISALWVGGLPRQTGWLVLLGTVGLLAIETFGFYLLALALAALALVDQRRGISSSV